VFMRKYFRGMHIRYVMVDQAKTPAALQEDLKKWPMRMIDEDERVRIYAVE